MWSKGSTCNPPLKTMADNFIGPWGTLDFHLPLGVLIQMGFLKFSSHFREWWRGWGHNKVFSTCGGWMESVLHWPKISYPSHRERKILPRPPLPNCYSPHQGFILPNPLNSTFLLKIFYQSMIMTSKMHWSITWTVI